MRVFNFAAGPAMLPLEVLEQVRAELTGWAGTGGSVMEASHRSPAFVAMAEAAESDLRDLLGIPGNYRVLFMQGGARAQFAAVPLNLAGADAPVDYLNTGAWSKLALEEAQRYCRVNIAADEHASGYCTVPEPHTLALSAAAAYLHYTPNETIGGVEFPFIPESAGVPLVADMTSTLLSRPLEVARYALIYAGAQKNIGPAGLTVVIVRDELLGRARPGTPTVWNYAAVAAQGSMANTPPTFAWYVAGLVFKWLKSEGGLAAIGQRNRAKAELLYGVIERSGFYHNRVARQCRSWMNVPFALANRALDESFLSGAHAAGLTNLAGHRLVGGMRASLYNAMPLAGVAALTDFMQEFERRYG